MSPNWPACIQKYAIVKRPYLNFSTVFMPNMPSLGLCKEVGLLLSGFLSKRICGSPSSPSSFCDFLHHFASLRSRSRSTPRWQPGVWALRWSPSSSSTERRTASIEGPRPIPTMVWGPKKWCIVPEKTKTRSSISPLTGVNRGFSMSMCFFLRYSLTRGINVSSLQQKAAGGS